MGQYIMRRLLQAIPLLFLISVLMFTLIHLLPGGPEAIYDNPELDAAGKAAIRASLGLDKPLPVQYFIWLTNSLTGNFGNSFATGEQVSSVLAEHLPATLELFLTAFVLALVLAVALGTFSAVHQGKMADYAITTITYFSISMPIFLLGLFMQDIFGVSLHWLPTSGTVTVGYTFSPFDTFLDHFLHLLMPMIVLSVSFTARWSRYLRAGMLEVTKQDYMRTGKAKGVAPAPLLIRHALRNAVIPLITIVAIDFGAVAGGAVITEGIFAWPGMGNLFLNSLNKRDFPVLLATLVLSATLVVVFNLVADILYAVMDPRIRYS
ncbi:MAG TPA: ABC transporter permease [Ktedonosporobacter sp.]|jgi:peptide/nickel transport system permease protein|nr:ABC transporter permease [Ktedonosporobacter sp.]